MRLTWADRGRRLLGVWDAHRFEHLCGQQVTGGVRQALPTALGREPSPFLQPASLRRLLESSRPSDAAARDAPRFQRLGRPGCSIGAHDRHQQVPQASSAQRPPGPGSLAVTDILPLAFRRRPNHFDRPPWCSGCSTAERHAQHA
jgi:hypothetical protein